MSNVKELMGDQARLPGPSFSPCLPQVPTAIPEAREQPCLSLVSGAWGQCAPVFRVRKNLTAGGAPSLDIRPSTGLRARPLCFWFFFAVAFLIN